MKYIYAHSFQSYLSVRCLVVFIVSSNLYRNRSSGPLFFDSFRVLLVFSSIILMTRCILRLSKGLVDVTEKGVHFIDILGEDQILRLEDPHWLVDDFLEGLRPIRDLVDETFYHRTYLRLH